MFRETPHICKKYYNATQRPANQKLALSVLDVLGDDLTSMASLDHNDRQAVINETGTARNLYKIRLQGSIYEESFGGGLV